MSSIHYLSAIAACCFSLTVAAQTPLGVTNLHGTWNEDNTVTLSFEAPQQGLDASMHLTDLTEITYITIAHGIIHQTSKVISSFSQPSPGEALSFTDSNVTPGEVYNYTVTTYVGDKHDDGVTTQVSNLQYPAPVTEAKAVTDKGKAPVTISFRAPSIDTEGHPLKSLSRITVKKYDISWNEVTVKNVSKPTPGESYVVTDATAPEGNTVYYYITPYTSDGQGYATTAYCYVGEDTPDMVIGLTAEATDDGVMLSWQPNEIGVNHGYVDNTTLTYTVKRSVSSGAEQTLAEGFIGTSYTDASEILLSSEQQYTYHIYCSNSHGTSSAATTSVFAGLPATLPWAEGFDTPSYTSATFDNGGWTADPQWVTNGSAYDINSGATITPHSGRGMAYVAYNNKVSARQSQALTSAHLNFRGMEQASISLFYHAMAGGFDNEIAIEASANDGEFVRIANFDYSPATSNQWLEAQADLSNLLPAETLRIRIVAFKGSNSTLAAIDDIRIEATEASIATLKEEDKPKQMYDLFGNPLHGKAKGFVLMEGRKIFCQ